MDILYKNYDKIARWLLYLMVLTIPIQALPKAYPLPGFMKNVGGFFLWILLAASVLYFWRNRKNYGVWSSWPSWLKGYLAAVCLWPVLCTVIGAATFPYWNETANEYLRHTGMVEKIAIVYPGIMENELLLHLKFAVSMVMGVVKGLLIPFLGIFFSLYVMFHRKDSRYILDTISRAAVVAALGFCAYSLIEIPWLLTGNTWCAEILSWINVHLYDVKTDHGWWPPLLWKGQLRSLTPEPSFFGIMAVFYIPLLWYRAAVLRKKLVWLLVVFFCYMIFLTHARTAQVIFLGELVLLALLSLWGRYPSWGKSLLGIFGTAVLAFAFYISVPVVLSSMKPTTKVATQAVEKNKPTKNAAPKLTQKPEPKTVQKPVGQSVVQAAQNYVKKDVASVIGLSKRSNTARLGNTVALFTIGMQNPVFGVGAGFESPYIADNIPAFAQNNQEIKRWISMLREEGYLDSPIPMFNMFGAVMCRYGIPGLLLFLIPLGMEFFYFLRKREMFLHSGGMICVLIALSGQVMSLLSNTIFYTYPLSLAITWLLMQRMAEELDSLEPME